MLIVGRRENYLYIYNISIDDTNVERSSKISISLLTCVLPSTSIRYNGARKFITLSQNGESPDRHCPSFILKDMIITIVNGNEVSFKIWHFFSNHTTCGSCHIKMDHFP